MPTLEQLALETLAQNIDRAVSLEGVPEELVVVLFEVCGSRSP